MSLKDIERQGQVDEGIKVVFTPAATKNVKFVKDAVISRPSWLPEIKIRDPNDVPKKRKPMI